MSAPAIKTLGEARYGQRLEILEIVSDCARAGKLAALGFLPGRQLRVARIAPLGDPISIEMEGQEISLRRTEARLIGVKEIF